MRHSNVLRGLGLVLALCFAASTVVAAGDAPKPSNDWRVLFDHWAESDGELVLHFAPEKGNPIDVTTKIPKDTRENHVAELVAGSLKGQLGGGYKVEVYDGEKVQIKTKGKTPKFVLSMGGSPVPGLNVKIKRS
jgi:hypothetical protein